MPNNSFTPVSEESLLAAKMSCTICHGEGWIHAEDHTVVACICTKHLRLFLAVGQAIYNTPRPAIEDERLRPDRRLLIRASWQWLAPRILGMACKAFTPVRYVTDSQVRDAHFRWKSEHNLESSQDLMAPQQYGGQIKLLILRLGPAPKTQGLDEILAEAINYREVGPIWIQCPHNYHSATPVFHEALNGFETVDSQGGSHAS